MLKLIEAGVNVEVQHTRWHRRPGRDDMASALLTQADRVMLLK